MAPPIPDDNYYRKRRTYPDATVPRTLAYPDVKSSLLLDEQTRRACLGFLFPWLLKEDVVRLERLADMPSTSRKSATAHHAKAASHAHEPPDVVSLFTSHRSDQKLAMAAKLGPSHPGAVSTSTERTQTPCNENLVAHPLSSATSQNAAPTVELSPQTRRYDINPRSRTSSFASDMSDYDYVHNWR